MIFCKDPTCPFHQINDENIVDLSFMGDDVIVIKPLHPTTFGHLLVIPTKHLDKLEDFKTSDWLNLMIITQKIVQRELYDGIDGPNYDLIIQKGKQAGQTVPHLHIHLVPRNQNDHNFAIQWNKDGI